MRKKRIEEGRKCPRCESSENQKNDGKNRSGTQRCLCKNCNCSYTLNPKTREYPEEVRLLAMKMLLSGVSARGVGKVLGFSKANVLNWVKKNEQGVDKSRDKLRDF